MSEAAITALPPNGMVTIRGDFASAPFAASLREVTGLSVPDTRRITLDGQSALGWMSPDELLWLCENGPNSAAALSKALGEQHSLIVDVSDARARFRIEGSGAREVIAKGAPVDMAKLSLGEIRRTRLGQVAVAFWMSEGNEAIDLICFRSVAGFVEEWLINAARPGTLPGIL